MDQSEDRRLLLLAATISDGARVDWSRLQANPAETGAPDVIRELALIDQIASFHRSTDPSGTATEHNARIALPDPETWGHFNILERVGSGAFGSVYRAKDTRLDSEVALKLLWPDPSDRAVDTRRALKEARLLARVRHPNVVAVHGADFLESRVGIWMEFVKGRTLSHLVNTQGPFGAREAALIGFDLCGALAAVHRAGLMHGDVKTHNVMREEGGRTVLMDFGTGKDLADEPADGQAIEIAGTPLYIAPEVFAGKQRTRLSDIYSLGVLLYHLVTGSYPVDGATRQDVEQAHARGARQYLRDVRPDLPEEFVRIVERALASDPRERYQTAGQFEAALGRFLGRTEVPTPSARRWPMLVASLGVLIVAAAAYTLALRWTNFGNARPAAPVVTSAPTATPLTGAAETTYQIETALYRVRENQEDRLGPGARVRPGDQLFATIRVSVPAYVYIVNEDDRGMSYLLFPLPGHKLTNPLAAGKINRIPDADGGSEMNWQVTTAGGREHFLVFASPERMPVFEQMFAALPSPEVGRPIQQMQLPDDAVRRLRGVGGLISSPGSANSARLSLHFATPLAGKEETAQGVWVRQLTVDNPIKQ